MGRNAGLRVAALDGEHPEAVEGLSQCVKDAAQHLRAGAWERRAFAGGDLASDVESGHVPKGHEKQPVLAETHNLGAHAEAVPFGPHEAELPKPDIGTVGLDDEPGDTGHLSQTLHRGKVADLGAQDLDERCDG
jgi:hypothetical protein